MVMSSARRKLAGGIHLPKAGVQFGQADTCIYGTGCLEDKGRRHLLISSAQPVVLGSQWVIGPVCV